MEATIVSGPRFGVLDKKTMSLGDVGYWWMSYMACWFHSINGPSEFQKQWLRPSSLMVQASTRKQGGGILVFPVVAWETKTEVGAA